MNSILHMTLLTKKQLLRKGSMSQSGLPLAPFAAK